MEGIDVSAFAHSPVHKAIILKDYASLKSILEALPRLSNPYEIHTEAASIAEEEKADKISSVVDRRDVPNGDTPLHLAAQIGDETATEMLMVAGACKNLKNKQGWSALSVAIANKHDKIALIIIRHSWQQFDKKWHRRLPRYIATMRRMRDFYMEITFHFESSVIPFISKIAPSDTYKIWKRGGNMRADMTLAGFDGLKIKRSDQSVLFLGDDLADGRKPPGSLCMVFHKTKEVIVASSVGSPVTEADYRKKLLRKSRHPTLRFGIDVTQSVLEPQMTWRRKERKEMVGPWKAKVYDMHNVFVWVKSRSVPGAKTDDKLSCNENEKELTEDERKQLEAARRIDTFDTNKVNESGHKTRENKEKKGQSSGRKEKEHQKGKESKDMKKSSANSTSSCVQNNGNGEIERKKGMRPILWLSQNYPLKTDELLPLLDILADKVKAIRRLRELLTTTLPKETFPVKVGIPTVPSVRVIVTFTKFEELAPVDEFSSAPSSPTGVDSDESAETSSTSGSWFQWGKGSNGPSSSGGNEDFQDLFTLSSEYKWITAEDKYKMKLQQQKNQRLKSQLSAPNYASWCRSFLAISIRNKDAFLTGQVQKPAHDHILAGAWKRCNDLLVSWLLKSLSPPIASTVFYVDDALQIWQKLEQRFGQLDKVEGYHLQQQLNHSYHDVL
ncbi:hypothetical protein L6164_013236 [Bauhinia variegata]|uniref:Uncharacterized protein n=1 Tax=Bauhinia variegata TaxID=167791 RepID=A0ACB9PBZ3_BAUVA|nr:hypothetical protein L6164_013236 [Bauhinia variegata]